MQKTVLLARRGAVRCGAVQLGAVWCGSAWRSAVQRSAVQSFMNESHHVKNIFSRTVHTTLTNEVGTFLPVFHGPGSSRSSESGICFIDHRHSQHS
jgi:hypothetical protein